MQTTQVVWANNLAPGIALPSDTFPVFRKRQVLSFFPDSPFGIGGPIAVGVRPVGLDAAVGLDAWAILAKIDATTKVTQFLLEPRDEGEWEAIVLDPDEGFNGFIALTDA